MKPRLAEFLHPLRGQLSRIELLESRIAPAVFTVTSLKDIGADTLRDAIDQANAAAGADTIEFAVGLAGTIKLGAALAEITDDLTITGPGSRSLTIDGANKVRIFSINGDGVDVDLSGLKLTRGFADAGGALSISSAGGQISIRDCVISGNKAKPIPPPPPDDGGGAYGVAESISDAAGGAIFISDGIVTISGCTISKNTATGYKGGGSALGGAIFAGSGVTLTISDSIISGNKALGANGTKGVRATPGDEYGVGATDGADATAGGRAAGGGIYAADTTVLTITNTTISGNLAKAGKGGAGIAGAKGANGAKGARGESGESGSAGEAGIAGAAGGDAFGGGVFSQGQLDLQNSTISGNTSIAGKGGKGGNGGRGGNGGNGGAGFVSRDGGYAQRYPAGYGGSGGDGGAGAYGGAGGSAEGGGVCALTGDVTIENSTISGNTTKHGNAGVGGAGGAGGAKGIGRRPPPPDDYGGGYDYAPPDRDIRGVDGGPARGIRGERGANGELGEGAGGGVFVGSGDLQMSQVTIAKNIASINGGGVAIASEAKATIMNATIASNRATGLVVREVIEDEYGGRHVEIVKVGAGGGIYVATEDPAAAGTINLISTIVGKNRARVALHADLFEAVAAIAGTNNLIQTPGDAVIDTTQNIVGVDPKLGKLALNGGTTATMLPAADSPAINAGANPDSLATDQRGAARVQGPAIDIGAVEAG